MAPDAGADRYRRLSVIRALSAGARLCLDVGDNLRGAISTNAEAARAAARVLAAFYIPSMPANLLERHGLDRDELAPVIEAFAAGEVQRALALTPDDVVDALSVAGTPEDRVQRLQHDVLPTGVDHLLLSFADPFTVRSWSGLEVDGVPDLAGQLRLFHDEVIPAFELAPAQYRGRRPATSIAIPPPAKSSPTARKPIPIQSTAVVFAPSRTSALTRGAPVAFIATMDQSPPDTFQEVVTWPRPVLEASQKCWAPGGPAGGPPECWS